MADGMVIREMNLDDPDNYLASSNVHSYAVEQVYCRCAYGCRISLSSGTAKHCQFDVHTADNVHDHNGGILSLLFENTFRLSVYRVGGSLRMDRSTSRPHMLSTASSW
jgi:hypothetical protein